MLLESRVRWPIVRETPDHRPKRMDPEVIWVLFVVRLTKWFNEKVINIINIFDIDFMVIYT